MPESVDLKLRNALRFVTMYNNRLRSALLRIASELEASKWAEENFETPLFAWPHARHWRTNWSWDYLPLAYPNLSFLKSTEPNRPPWGAITISHMADTGILSAQESLEKEPSSMPPVEECKTLWIIRYCLAGARAKPIDKNTYNQSSWESRAKIFFPDNRVWSYDIDKHRRVEIERNSMIYGHCIFDAQEILTLPDFEDKVISYVRKIDKDYSAMLDRT